MAIELHPDQICPLKRNNLYKANMVHEPGPGLGRDPYFMFAICMNCGHKIRSPYGPGVEPATTFWSGEFIIHEWP